MLFAALFILVLYGIPRTGQASISVGLSISHQGPYFCAFSHSLTTCASIAAINLIAIDASVSSAQTSTAILSPPTSITIRPERPRGMGLLAVLVTARLAQTAPSVSEARSARFVQISGE